MTDSDGDPASAPLTIEIVDDVPTARNDSATQATENASITVNALANDTRGADGVDLVTGISHTSPMNGANAATGTLTYHDDGTFTYAPGAGETGTVTFQYTITDADGDPSTATVTITLLSDSTPTVDITPNGASLVHEAGLPSGSDPGDSKITTGTLGITTGGDTLASVFINGIDVTTGGTVTGLHGTLTVSLSGGVYSYSYTLTSPTTDAPAVAETDPFSVTVTDSDGDPASAPLTIEIVDDVPTARNDSTTQAAENAFVTVNALANDTRGADGVNLVTGVSHTSPMNGANAATGTLTYHNDGTFTYAPGAGETGTVTFQYTITDADGDPSTATVTITLLGDSTPTVDITPSDPQAAPGTGLVHEAGLPSGSDPGDSKITTGTLHITTGGDTLASVVINGVDVTGGGTVDGLHGTLTVSLSGGIYSYSYTLTGTTTDAPAVPETDPFTVTVTDSDGDPASASLTIEIVDDVPTARNDSTAQATENASVTVNALANDTRGADGVNLTTGVSHTSPMNGANAATGTLTYHSDGTFTYAPGAGETGTVTFQYTITDADGDPSTATVTINLLGDSTPTVDITPNGASLVHEAGLPSGSDPGSSKTTTGTLDITTGNDALASVVINGVDVTSGGTVNGAHGTLTVSLSGGVYSYSYTLTGTTTDVPAVAETDSFTVTVTDSDGDPASAPLTIEIVDDVPTARNDSTTQAAENASVTVNALANDTRGADGVNLVTGVSHTSPMNGANAATGTLTYHNDGTFTYAPGAGETGTVTFQYTITDADGDPSTATVIITLLSDSTPTVDITPNGASLVHEAGLPTGSDPGSSKTTTGTLDITTGGDTLASVFINGVDVTSGGTVNGAHGTLTISLSGGVYSYSYTLTGTTTDVPAVAETDAFTVTVTDSDGDPASAPLTIEIVDDVPTARNDSATQATENASIIVNALANDTRGADGVNLTTGVSHTSPMNGANAATGTLTYHNDGTFTYAPGAGETGTVTFQYTITDADGDPSTATVTITLLSDSTPTVDITPNGASLVHEAGLPSGSDPGDSKITTGTLDITTGNDTLASVVINGINVTSGGTVNGAHGTLTISLSGGVYSYSYTLTGTTTDVPAVAETDSFTVTVADSDGDPASAPLTIEIVDDVPLARNDSDVVDNATSQAAGNVITGAGTTGGAAGADVQGADGATVTTVASNNAPGNLPVIAAGVITITGQYGTLVMQANGSYVYTRSGSGALQASEVFTYTLTDGDGDAVTATLTLTLGDHGVTITDLTPAASGGDAVVYEAALSIGSNPSSPNEASTGTFKISAPDGVNTVTIGGVVVVQNGALVPANSSFTTTLGNTFTVTNYNSATGEISYSYTLNANEAHPTGNGNNSLFENLPVVVTDTDGDSGNGTLAVNIIDDVPTLGAFLPGTLPNTIGSVDGTFTLSPGADGIDRFFISGPTITGISYTQTVAPDGTTTLHAQTQGGDPVFSLAVKPDGTYHFDLLDPQPEIAVTQSLTTLASGGPTPWIETSDGLIEFTGSGSGVNSSTQGFGVGNQFISAGENFTMEFHSVGSPGNTPATTDPQFVGKLDFDASGSGGSVSWTATNSLTNQTQSGTATVVDGHLVIDPTIDFNLVSITGTDGSIRLQAVSVGKLILPPDYSYQFNITAQDHDGDVTTAQTLDIHVTTGSSGLMNSQVSAFAEPLTADSTNTAPEAMALTASVDSGKTESSSTAPQPSSEPEHVALVDGDTVPMPATSAAETEETGNHTSTSTSPGSGTSEAPPPIPEHILEDSGSGSIDTLLPPSPTTTPAPAANGESTAGALAAAPASAHEPTPVPAEAEELAKSMVEQGHQNQQHL
ncbi:MAG: Ig-like domain-containing protein [Ottowia sp.]